MHRCISNVGVYPTFDIGTKYTDAPFIFYSHSDVEMREYGWDEKLSKMLDILRMHTHNKVGVCGMFGAKGLGTPDIYLRPYDFRQLMRWGTFTVEDMEDAGGDVLDKPWESCLVLDGFSLICNRQMLDDVKGFDHEKYTSLGAVHHMYDNRICLRSHFAGYRNFVVDVNCKHLGGVTSCREDWADKFELGTDENIHRRAHEIFYEEFRGKLPVSV